MSYRSKRSDDRGDDRRGDDRRSDYKRDYRRDRDEGRRSRKSRSPSPIRKRSRNHYEDNYSHNSRNSKHNTKRDEIPNRDEKSSRGEKPKKEEKPVSSKNKKPTEEPIPKPTPTPTPVVNQIDEEEQYKKRIEEQLLNLTTNEEEQIKIDREKRRQRLLQTSNIQEQQSIQDQPIQPIQEQQQPVKEQDETAKASDQERNNFLHQLELERNKAEANQQPSIPIQDENQKDEEQEDDEFDMFSDKELPTVTSALHGPQLSAHQLQQSDHPNLSANWNDEEGYYCFRTGEILQERFRVLGFHGKGVFGSVLKAADIHNEEQLVAIKVLRNNEWMKKSGLKEIELLQKLNASDIDNNCHCVTFKTHFQFRNHLCLVFESLDLDLRNILKKYGREQGRQVGISMQAVLLYAKQLFTALLHLKKNHILHADIKPDNILVNEKRNSVKLCDFGSGSDISDNAITPYLVSRFYRAPEIVLGMKYDYGIDIWSIGCSLFELFTGEILFASRDNNDLLYKVQQVKGSFNQKMLKKCTFREKHFDGNGDFMYRQVDVVTGNYMIRRMTGVPRTRDIKSLLFDANMDGEQGDTRRRIIQFADLLEKCLTLDPAKRITVQDALEHDFLKV
ncbi:serine/threonine-protein kinase [Acrasis kona]|uniref:non-specific serine/threonine protein kinase n=1 Tax=Acrasis kona TaxID=1008807 RepID=A0AAW2Z4F1_9EUKA